MESNESKLQGKTALITGGAKRIGRAIAVALAGQGVNVILQYRRSYEEAGELQEILDRHTDPWGVKVTAVEVKHIDLPTEMQRAIARQAEAERERRAKIIAAEGEYQAAGRLLEAAQVIAQEPTALQLRFLQTLSEVATEKNSTTIFPLPIDMLEPFVKHMKKQDA